MPPRWLLIAVIAVYVSSKESAITAEILNTLPVASNGWRPIVGTQVKPYVTTEQQIQKQTISLTSNDQEHKHKNEKNKIIPIQKGNPVHINHHGSTGHHPLTLKSKQTSKPAPRHPVLGKLHAHLAHSKRHKPQPQPPRDEIMAPAPSSAIGSYAYFNQGPISIQNTQLGGNKPYQIPGHVDFSNHYAFSNVNNDVVLPPQQYNFQKHPNQNELHPNHYLFINQNDDFTRNLVPPPPIYKPQGEKETLLVKEPPKINDHNSQFVLGKHKDEINRLPENVIVQLSPNYNQYQQQNIAQPAFDLEITKENFKEYHTTLAPSSYKTSTESFLDATKYTKSREYTKPSQHFYEVTEEKEWAEQLPTFKAVYPTLKQNEAQVQQYKNKYPAGQDSNRFHFVQQSDFVRPQQDDSINTQFLPTPYNPDSAFPTSPTQAEISTIYSEISQINKKKNAFKVSSTPVYNIKEVATHFPIYSDKRPGSDTQINIPSDQKDEVTTVKEIENTETETTLPYNKPTPQTTFPTRGSWSGQRRPNQRRRRPTRPTTTESFMYETDAPPETERPTMRPHRRRRPVKQRTTETSTVVETTTRAAYVYRPKPTRAQPTTITEEVFVSKNHLYRPTYQLYPNLEDDRTFDASKEEENANNYKNDDIVQQTTTTEIAYNNHQSEDEVLETEPPVRIIHKRKRLRPILTTTEIVPVTNLNIPENELDYTTIPSNDEHEQSEETVTIREILDFETEKEYSTTLTVPSTVSTTTPTTTTTTTTEASTTKSNRIRQRPIKYDVQRPRFSVKDYRQRLNQYMSTSTESTKSSSETAAPTRIRYPNRFRISTPRTDNEESTESTRQKFAPKEPRRKIFTTESSDVSDISSTEKNLRTMNPRLKSFGRYRSTTETVPSTSTTQKIAIKPNIFTNLKRPQPLSLRNRIYNKKRNSTTTTTTEAFTEEPETTEPVLNTEQAEVTIPFELAESKIEVTTQLYDQTTTAKPTVTVKVKSNDVPQDETEAFLQLQRISDLTSSAHKQYNTPGMFKSVSPTSRRVPSYFKISTEDPILPIEAFFSKFEPKT